MLDQWYSISDTGHLDVTSDLQEREETETVLGRDGAPLSEKYFTMSMNICHIDAFITH